MQLQRELLPNFRTANEENVEENVHTAPSFSFSTYCEMKEKEKQKRYMEEEFNLSEDRSNIFGPHNGCQNCEGTGWCAVSSTNMLEPLRALWVQAEVDSTAEDGYHLVQCPVCCPYNDGSKAVKYSLDEHIVRKDGQFELKSKKSGKNLGTYPSKAGAVKREKQVSYFKHLKEDGGGNPFKTHWEQAVLPGDPDRKELKEEQPSEYNQKQSQDKKDQKSQETTNSGDKKQDDNRAKWEKKKRSADKKKAEEKERSTKKLLPYEFTDQKDAERAAGHLGMHGSHTTGNGIYKPGTSDMSLRDAVARKKQKQRMRSGKVQHEENENNPIAAYPQDKIGLHETIDILKECVLNTLPY